jgi:hypothetical protein
LIKSACKPFTIGYDEAKSKMISSSKVEETYKVQYIELRADDIDAEKPKSAFTFEKDELHMKADTAMAS